MDRDTDKTRLLFEELEPRVLFSAGGLDAPDQLLNSEQALEQHVTLTRELLRSSSGQPPNPELVQSNTETIESTSLQQPLKQTFVAHNESIQTEPVKQRLLATLTVTNNNDLDNGNTSSITDLIADDGGDGVSLREAIQAANNTPGADEIRFEITGSHSIELATRLPSINEALTIDGTSDSDYVSSPIIELDGQNVSGTGIDINTDSSTIRGLAVNNFNGVGIEVRGDNNRVELSYIGLSTDGNSGAGNSQLGIRIENGANNVIDRNVISDSGWSGLAVVGSASNNNIIQGNFIGTNASGTAAVGNNDYGIDLWNAGANSNVVGGNQPAERNVISGNGWAGIHQMVVPAMSYRAITLERASVVLA